MTASRRADYVYRNSADTVRLRVFQRENGRWDYDVFHPDGDVITFSVEAGDDFRTKRDALAWANRTYGPLSSINVGDSVSDDAWRRRASRTLESHGHSSMKKTSAQLDREIARALAREKDDGIFYLTDNHERALGPEFSTRLAAKRAAMKLVRERAYPRVEVWHRWRGDRYMQGLASEEGWSDV